MSADLRNTPWSQLKIQLRKTWSELTNEDLEMVSRDTNKLASVVVDRYSERNDTATTRSTPVGHNSIADSLRFESHQPGNGTEKEIAPKVT